MNITTLLATAAYQGSDVSAIYTGVGNLEDQYAIMREQEEWNVFYSEKGVRFELRTFATENEAC